jgi:hypothetical protein
VGGRRQLSAEVLVMTLLQDSFRPVTASALLQLLDEVAGASV